MKAESIVIIADIHGNLTALEAVLAEIDRLGPSYVAVAGDLALGGPRPAECVELIRRRGYPAIRGNTDEWLTKKPARVTDAITWAAAQLSDDDRAFLAGLPFQWRHQAAPGDMVAVHATPWSISDLIEPDAPESLITRVFEETRASAVVYGHIHRAYIREFREKVLVNSGSVGLPFDGDQRAAFALFHPESGSWQPEIKRVSYDVSEALRAAEKSNNPERERWARRIRNAGF